MSEIGEPSATNRVRTSLSSSPVAAALMALIASATTSASFWGEMLDTPQS
jgi:hypothetical protein